MLGLLYKDVYSAKKELLMTLGFVLIFCVFNLVIGQEELLGPYIGVLLSVGVLAGLLSSGLVLGAYAALADRAAGMLQGMEFMGPDMVLPLTAVWPLVLGGFLLFGILLGSLGTTLSMRKYLNV